MRQDKKLYLVMKQLVIILYFILTTSIFYLSLNEGYNGITLKIFGGGDDGFFYWSQAKNVMAGEPWIKTSIYPLILGYLLKLTNIESVYIVRLFNFTGFLLLLLISKKLIKIQFLYDSNDAFYRYFNKANTLLLICFLFYVSLQMQVNLSIYRDIWIYMFYALSVYLSIKIIYFKKNKLYYSVALLLSLGMLGGFRDYALLSFLISLIIMFCYSKIKVFRNSKRGLFFLFLGFILYYSLFLDFTVADLSLRRALNYRMDGLTTYSGGSQMGINLAQSNVIVFFLNYLHSYIGNLLGPLPWHVSGISTLGVFFLETIPMIFILMFIWRNRILLTKLQKYILVHSFVWVSLIAITNDNVGTASRLRPIAWILILIIFVFLYAKKQNIQFMKREK